LRPAAEKKNKLHDENREIKSVAFGHGKMSGGWVFLSNKHPDS